MRSRTAATAAVITAALVALLLTAGGGGHRPILAAVPSSAVGGGTLGLGIDVSGKVSANEAPVNTVLPTITGLAEEGGTLTAGNGTWTNSPSSFTYNWQDCNAGGLSCSANGGTASTLTLGAGDVGHTMRVAVVAKNVHGTGEAISNATAVVTAGGGGGTTNCFPEPSSCSKPSKTNQGAEHYSGKTCSELSEVKVESQLAINSPGTIEHNDYKIKLKAGGFAEAIKIQANGVIFKQDCFIVEGAEDQGPVIYVDSGKTGFKVTESTIRATNETTQSYGDGIRAEGGGGNVTVEKSVIYSCNECLKGDGAGTYVTTHNWISTDNLCAGCSHTENYFLFGGFKVESTFDTLLVPGNQTAISIYEQGAEACTMSMVFEHDLFAGSGQMFQGCKGATSEGTAKTKIVGNNFAKCTGSPIEGEAGTKVCTGGADSHGYYPLYAAYHIFGTFTGANGLGVVTFSENVRDDTGAAISLECAKEGIGC